MYNLFTYGTLKRGFNNHEFLKSSIFLGQTTTVEKYMLLDVGLPILINYSGETSKNIKGELYFVTQHTLENVDRLEGHPHMYQRELIKVIHPIEKEVVEVFAYFFMANGFTKNHLQYVESLEEWK
jgi:gamma-glutamylaminecyclotransferase